MLTNKYHKIIDVDKEVDIRKKDISDLDKKIVDVKNSYFSKRELYEKLLSEISVFEEDLEFISFGMYSPSFDFDSSDIYKESINEAKRKQKKMISNKEAIVCNTEWQVEGSKAKGRQMANRNMKLILRAFNNECDAAIAKVKWNNVTRMEEKIEKAFDAINKLAEPISIEITYSYLTEKLNELRLTHEYHEKKYEEKEEQRQIREQMREEEKAIKEYDKKIKEAEKEEAQYEKALVIAREELQKASDSDKLALEAKIKELQEQIDEAEENRQRAISLAQQTRRGHVYVISNIGSFGDNIYKIGMTRRLEPLDRVKELGDASVPFTFDVHALIFSDDAPKLEKELHKHFDDRRLNLVNNRKEFFKVDLHDVERIVLDNHGEFEFTKLAEAKEYRETISIRDKLQDKSTIQDIVNNKFPDMV